MREPSVKNILFTIYYHHIYIPKIFSQKIRILYWNQKYYQLCLLFPCANSSITYFLRICFNFFRLFKRFEILRYWLLHKF